MNVISIISRSWNEARTRKIWEALILLSILLLGSFLRLRQLESWSHFSALDGGRDVLVAKHMAQGKASLFISPASATQIQLNSPLYYWIISLAYFIGGDYTAVYFVFYTLGMVSILLFYYCCKMIVSSRLWSIIPTVFFTIHPYAIHTSSIIFQPHLVVGCVLIGLSCLLYGQSKRSLVIKSLGYLFLLFAPLIHGSGLVLLPPIAFLMVWDMFLIRKQQKVLIPYFLYCCMLWCLFVLLTFVHNGNQTFSTSLSSNAITFELVNAFMPLSFFFYLGKHTSAVSYTLLLLFTTLLIFWRKTYPSLLLSLLFTSSLFTVAFPGQPIFDNYFSPFFPIFILQIVQTTFFLLPKIHTRYSAVRSPLQIGHLFELVQIE